MKWLWWIVAALCGVAAVSVFFAFQKPDFVLGLGVAAIAAIYQALKPAILKRMPPEDESEWRELQKRGASQKEINAWQRARLLKKRQRQSLPR